MKDVNWNQLADEQRSRSRNVMWSKVEMGVVEKAAEHGISDGQFLKEKFPKELSNRTAVAVKHKVRYLMMGRK